MPLLLAGWLVACPSPEPPKPPATTAQTPSTNAAQPGVTELRAELPAVVDQVRQRHNLAPDALKVTLTDTLALQVELNGKSCARQVPEGIVPAELVTNFDHTLDRCVQELVGSR